MKSWLIVCPIYQDTFCKIHILQKRKKKVFSTQHWKSLLKNSHPEEKQHDMGCQENDRDGPSGFAGSSLFCCFYCVRNWDIRDWHRVQYQTVHTTLQGQSHRKGILAESASLPSLKAEKFRPRCLEMEIFFFYSTSLWNLNFHSIILFLSTVLSSMNLFKSAVSTHSS